MTDTTTPVRAPQPGERVLWAVTGQRFDVGASGWAATSYISRRGDVLVLTADTIAANLDRFGHGLFDLLHDPDAQRARWGEVHMIPLSDDEPVPDEYQRLVPGSVEAGIEFDRRRLRILSEVADPEQRDRQLAALRREFQPRTSQRSTFIRGNSGNAADDAPRRGTERGRA